MPTVRPYSLSDESSVLALASRLQIGRQPWRDADAWLKTVQSWVSNSIASHGEQTHVFVAEDENGLCGFATVSHHKHFSGQKQANIGELVTAAESEGKGVGQALLAACEDWARSKNYDLLTLSTGAANGRALKFYNNAGFVSEDICLTKQLQ